MLSRRGVGFPDVIAGVVRDPIGSPVSALGAASIVIVTTSIESITVLIRVEVQENLFRGEAV
jgi:hypothetical protein